MTSLTIGDKVSFSYLKGSETSQDVYPQLVDYSSKAANYEGTVEGVRDITQQPLEFETIAYGRIKGERSKNLVTVSIDGDGSKAFYDGRMVNVQRQEA